MKGRYFKHPARKNKYKYLIAERIRKHPCWYCPKKLKNILTGDCNYVSCGGFEYMMDKKEKILKKIRQSCVYKYAPLGKKYNYKFEIDL